MEDFENHVEKSNETTGDLSSTSMVGRVAAAIYANPAPGCACVGPNPICRCKIEAARRAIGAMREPTRAMLIAGENMNPSEDNYPPDTTWQRMIDEALK